MAAYSGELEEFVRDRLATGRFTSESDDIVALIEAARSPGMGLVMRNRSYPSVTNSGPTYCVTTVPNSVWAFAS
jgi:hypothetical protein